MPFFSTEFDRQNFRALRIIDADLSCPINSIAASFVNGGDPTRTASATILRTPWLDIYNQLHPSHVALPLDTFVAVRVVPVRGRNDLVPVWIYGGCDVTFADDGMGGWIATRTGRPGPSISAGSMLPDSNNYFDIGITLPLDSPWDTSGESVSLGATLLPREQPQHTVASLVDYVLRRGVQWNGRTDADGNPRVVPVNLQDFTRADRLRYNLGGAVPGGGLLAYTAVRLGGARRAADSRILTFTTTSSTAAVGMYLDTNAGSHGYAEAETAIAAITPGVSLIMASVPQLMGNNAQHAWVGGIELSSVIAEGRRVSCASTAGITVGMQMVWGIYDWATDTWSAGTEVVGEVKTVKDGTTLVLKEPCLAWYGDMWAHEGDLDIGGSDGAVNLSDGYTADGWTIATA